MAQYQATHAILKFKWLDDLIDGIEEEEKDNDIDVFSALLSDGHGVTIQTQEPALETWLNLDPSKCTHRMVSLLELMEDMETSLYEQFCPSEPGPWEVVLGDIVLGYEGLSDTIDMLDDRWDIEYNGWSEEQALNAHMDSLAIKVVSECLNEERKERLSNIMAWFETAPIQLIRKHRKTFWKRLLASRRACSATGFWWHVYLTKKQADVVIAEFKKRLG